MEQQAYSFVNSIFWGIQKPDQLANPFKSLM